MKSSKMRHRGEKCVSFFNRSIEEFFFVYVCVFLDFVDFWYGYISKKESVPPENVARDGMSLLFTKRLVSTSSSSSSSSSSCAFEALRDSLGDFGAQGGGEGKATRSAWSDLGAEKFDGDFEIQLAEKVLARVRIEGVAHFSLVVRCRLVSSTTSSPSSLVVSL